MPAPKPKARRGERNRPRHVNTKSIALMEQGGHNSYRGKQNPNAILTEQQRRYVNALVRLKFNKTAAAREAGYTANSISKAVSSLTHNPKIIKAIALETEAFAKASAMSKKKVIDGLLEAIEMAKIQSDPTPMIQGWTQIARMCGYMEPTKHKVEVSVNGSVVIQRLQQLDDAQLLALAEGDADALEGEFTQIDRP